MKKLKLQIDALAVETFDTAAVERGEGTVVAYATRIGQRTCPNTYDGYTCAVTCLNCPVITVDC